MRDGQVQASGVPRAKSLDLVITNAIVLDPTRNAVTNKRKNVRTRSIFFSLKIKG